MRNFSITLTTLTGLLACMANAQIVTQTLKGEALKSSLKATHRPTPVVSKSFVVTKIELVNLLDEDRKEAALGYPFRFGKAFNVDLGLTQGVWTDIEEGRVWQLQITAPKAYHLNFQFDKFYIAKGAELILYNSDKTVQMGPITHETNNGYNTLATDVIQGETIIIELSS